MATASSFLLKKGEAPPAPTQDDEVIIYFKTDGQLYYKGNDNIEHAFNGVPPGGVLGSSLVKKSVADFDTEWKKNEQIVVYEGELPALSEYPEGTIFVKKE